MSASRIRVVVADDQELIRRGMALLLSAEPDIEVVGLARDGLEALELARLAKPDIVLMDLHMPRMGGVAATREIASTLRGTRVIVLTTFDADESVFEAVRAGARAYLLKDASEQELLETVRIVRRGESVLTPHIASKVMDQFRHLALHQPVPARPWPPDAAVDDGRRARPANGPPGESPEPLSAKEERILRLIAEGKSNKQIAQAVFLAEGTVKNYVSRIMDKLHANTRTELAVMTVRSGRAR